MKIYSDILTPNDLRICAPHYCFVAVCNSLYRESSRREASRQRKRGYSVILSGTNSRQVMGHPDIKGATYDEWGVFLANIYSLDADAICGPYTDALHFEQETKYKYESMDVTGKYYGHCDTCGADCDGFGCTKDRNHKIAIEVA